MRHKEHRGIENRLRNAKFPVTKSLDDFDYSFQPSINRKKLKELASIRFIDNRENILFLGPPGVGNTTFYIANDWKICRQYKVFKKDIIDYP